MPAETRAESPYELVLGERISGLHPVLQAYFRGLEYAGSFNYDIVQEKVGAV